MGFLDKIIEAENKVNKGLDKANKGLRKTSNYLKKKNQSIDKALHLLRQEKDKNSVLDNMESFIDDAFDAYDEHNTDKIKQFNSKQFKKLSNALRKSNKERIGKILELDDSDPRLSDYVETFKDIIINGSEQDILTYIDKLCLKVTTDKKKEEELRKIMILYMVNKNSHINIFENSTDKISKKFKNIFIRIYGEKFYKKYKQYNNDDNDDGINFSSLNKRLESVNFCL